LVFLLLPRCQGECGSQKYTAGPVPVRIWACGAISGPWSRVRGQRSYGVTTLS
jgi:hypothetical protein